MEASDPESYNSDRIKSEETNHQPDNDEFEDHSNSSSPDINSIFSLTIDEFQYRSGRSFGSMNMDELLNSVWNTLDGNNLASTLDLNENEFPNDKNGSPPINIPQQGTFNIPTPFCNKTVDEVWAEIVGNESPQNNPNMMNNDFSRRQQTTFGEMTLEDFLVKVGVIQEASSLLRQQKNTNSLQNHHGDFPNHHGKFPCNDACLGPRTETGTMTGLEFSHPTNENNFQPNGSPMYQAYTPCSGSFVGEPSNNSSIGNGQCNGVGEAHANGVGEAHTKRRTSNGSVELAVERRQRRMIKNRESAARSRARKQAYTAELEIELNQLREENARLKLIVGEAENKRKTEAVKGKPPSTKAKRTAEKFQAMRRTSSLAW